MTMNRDELGRKLADVVNGVADEARVGGRPITWGDMEEGEREALRRSAERFLAAVTQAPRYARVSLMGKRVLGLVRVTEATLCGAPMLRCEADGQDPLWVNPAAVYTLAEVADETAQAEIAKHAADEDASRAQRAAEAAALHAARAAATAEIVVDEPHELTAIRTSATGLLHYNDPDVRTRLRARGIFAAPSGLYDKGEYFGIVVPQYNVAVVEALALIAREYEFASVSVRAVNDPDEINDEAIPF